jgi:hypothetical protein
MRGNPTKAKIDGAENVRYDVSIRLCGRKVRAKRKRRKEILNKLQIRGGGMLDALRGRRSRIWEREEVM